MKTVVIGGGGGGIASALLASLRGEEVTLLEAHENLGGCASWFRRGPFSFDVGATTLSGVSSHQPLGKIFALLYKKPELYLQNPGIVFHLSNGKKLHYFSDFEAWMMELERVFPQLSHRSFWQKVYTINAQAWDLLDTVKSFPFKKMTDLFEVFSRPDLFHLYPALLVNTELMLKIHGLDHPDYLELINGILLISAQAHADKIPFLVGAMGLAYPGQTYAPAGGMEGFFNFLEQECHSRGVNVHKKAIVSKIANYKVFASDRDYEADRVIMNVPCWNQADFFDGADKFKLSQNLDMSKEAWGAFTLYFAVQGEVKELYQQVHLNHSVVKNYFISFSKANDLARAPQGWQCVTISTHVEAKEWFEFSKIDYQTRKKQLLNLILSDFKQRFTFTEYKFITAGTPKTFERYTSRKWGYVGGLPFLYGMNPLEILSCETAINNVFRVGDTIFPGQGIVGVVAGAMALDAKLKKR